MKLAALTFGLALFGMALPARADVLQPKSGTVEVQDFAFDDGETMPKLVLGYLTLGTPHRDASGAITNAVLLLHGTTGSARSMMVPGIADALYGPGQPLDAAHHYLIIPDGIGAGASSKPSDGMHARFPRYGYRDQVRAQHDLIARLGIGHLELVLGTSMGGMQTWLWGEMYPEDSEALVAVASTPAPISGRNMMWREMIVQAIRDDPDWRNGDYSKDNPPRDWIRAAIPLFAIMTGSAEQLQKEAPTRAAAVDLVNALEAKAKSYDANDFLYAFESSAEYDPVPKLAAITKPLLSINFADDLLNPSKLVNLPNQANIKGVMLSGDAANYGHQTLAHAAVYAPALQAFLAGLKPSH